MDIKSIIVLLILVLISGCKSSDQNKGKVLYSDTFDATLNNWIIEQMEGGEVNIADGRMNVSQSNGAIVWFKEKLHVSITIDMI
ncbi:hypothetical protein VOI54_17385 [Tamlana sp. 2201CG12-4]|uniref:hypothetical protein n=1 Tax=Tamlana sp. 2201CG12-4 TaxID=3112582 RepID=UPI002DBC6772|nr:hypothetical protein [Tamlana sp. 2201CG12-4]MEC3908804.1 hypothetical protein [Tamlana sp. 2201CG12-4]